jgi:hypothetical protein
MGVRKTAIGDWTAARLIRARAIDANAAATNTKPNSRGVLHAIAMIDRSALDRAKKRAPSRTSPEWFGSPLTLVARMACNRVTLSAFIAGVTAIPKGEIGAIHLQATKTLLDVAEPRVELVLKKLNGIQFKGRKLAVRPRFARREEVVATRTPRRRACATAGRGGNGTVERGACFHLRVGNLENASVIGVAGGERRPNAGVQRRGFLDDPRAVRLCAKLKVNDSIAGRLMASWLCGGAIAGETSRSCTAKNASPAGSCLCQITTTTWRPVRSAGMRMLQSYDSDVPPAGLDAVPFVTGNAGSWSAHRPSFSRAPHVSVCVAALKPDFVR